MCITQDWALNPLQLNAVHRGWRKQTFSARLEDEDDLIRRVRSIEDGDQNHRIENSLSWKIPHPRAPLVPSFPAPKNSSRRISSVNKKPSTLERE
ncbi:hypothetical protein T265_10412 [Opisthorchis viverrini]|uniref:Uncharacterized protein n=1 Tax=Opisthorchis viverrini TaxID=6198 RepID=A0A074Z6N4_OPIVI|nr:hypothetical protein T265_10412 [Opisthorchis viverrini]KER21202.1 hypothetical protein T265_10412 [Opisthorchis viverrini]